MDKEKQIKILELTSAGKDEMNLAEFPFALLSDKGRGIKTLQFTDTITGKEGRPVVRKWTITASDKFGMPTRDDEKVYVALMQITKENSFETPEQFFSRYRVLKTIGWPTNDGRYYKRVENALDRFIGMTIKAENAFYEAKKKAYLTVAFHIIDNYKLWDKGEEPQQGQRTLPLSYFKWNEVIWKSMQNGYIKNLDTKFWFSLHSAIARRLHRYLDKKFYRDHIFKIELKKLAFEKLGMSRAYVPAKIKSLLNPACEELIDRGYLKSYTYERRDSREEIITFIRSEKGRQIEMSLSKDESDILKELTNRGLTKTTASKLIKEHPIERIVEKIELHDYLRSSNSPLLGKNPAGYLRKAIEDDYTPPGGFTTKAEREQRKRAEQEMIKEQELRRKEKDYQDWLNMSDEEKVKGDLWLWKFRFKREQGTEPTPEQIEAKKQELISKLPTPEEMRERTFRDT